MLEHYTLNGEPEQIAEIRALEPGGEITFGGGAAPVFVLRRDHGAPAEFVFQAGNPATSRSSLAGEPDTDQTGRPLQPGMWYAGRVSAAGDFVTGGPFESAAEAVSE